jgi:hypothetical protein
MVMQEIRKYPLDYTVLAVGLLFAFVQFFNFLNVPETQKNVISLTAVFYFFWGVIHHAIRKDLTIKIVVEYLAFALVAIIASRIILNLL